MAGRRFLFRGGAAGKLHVIVSIFNIESSHACHGDVVKSTKATGIRASESQYVRGGKFDRQTRRNGRKSRKALKKRTMARLS
jgi:hypothetical protein